MLRTIVEQVNLILFSLLAGAITGIMFDLYRLFRGFENPNKILTFIEDILFWVLTSIVVFIFLVVTDNAYLSVYVFVYIGVGIFLYIKLVSKPFLYVQHKIMTGTAKSIRITRNFIIYPLQLVSYRVRTKNKRKLRRKNLKKVKNKIKI